MKSKYCYYAHLVKYSNYFDFSLVELKSLFRLNKISFEIDQNYSYDIRKECLVKFYTDDEINKQQLKNIFSRAVLIRNIFYSYGINKSIEELILNMNQEDFKKEAESLEPFRFDIEGLDISLEKEYQLELMKKFAVFNFKAKVNLNKAERFFIIYYNKLDGLFHFGKVLGKCNEKVNFYTKYNLQDRKYLGPTSTDNRLSFLMANFAQIDTGDMVLDPFAGTGSLLIPATHLGGLTYGSDLDIRVLKGYKVGYTKESLKTKKKGGENIFTNFKEYKLPLPNIFRADINYHKFFKEGQFDSIICDPPYGIRAMTRQNTGQMDINHKFDEKINLIEGEEKENNIILNKVNDIANDEDFDPYNDNTLSFTPLIQCTVNKLFENLLNSSSYNLKVNGLMVCLYPVLISDEEIE